MGVGDEDAHRLNPRESFMSWALSLFNKLYKIYYSNFSFLSMLIYLKIIVSIC